MRPAARWRCGESGWAAGGRVEEEGAPSEAAKQASGAGRARGTPFRIHLDRQLSLICRPAEPDSAESPAASSAVIMLVSPFFS